MFFSDDDLVLTKRSRLRTLPPIVGDWRPRAFYPDLSQAVGIGFDFEVKENDFEHGPGWSRGKAQICGGSIDAIFRDGSAFCAYYPVGHEVEPEYNLDRVNTMAYFKSVLETPYIPKFGANLIYDVGNASDEGIFVQGEYHDCQFAEALLNESGLVDLDYLGKKYLKEGKEKDILYEWLAETYGGKPTGKQRENIYRASPRMVGPYAEGDAKNPRLIVAKQWPLLAKEGLLDLYRIECDLIPLYVRMRRQGVRVNVDRAEKIYNRLTPLIKTEYEKVFQIGGKRIEATTGNALKELFKHLNIKMPITESGNDSITKEFLNELDHPIAEVILEIRKLEIVQNTFLKHYVLGSNVKGIIHGEFHPLRNDEGGTRVGRLSSSNPNLQNVPIRTDLGKEIRKCFVPFEGHSGWIKNDFSQIQYRALAHHAVGQGSDELRAAYNADPDIDYHDRTMAMVKEHTGVVFERRPIKNINFAIPFGAGKKKIKRMLGVEANLADKFYDAYFKANPYAKATLDHFSKQAQRDGYIATVLGRRTHFDLWEPADVDWDNRAIPLPYGQAIRQYGARLQRAKTHTAIAGLLQGDEGDIMKSAMLRALKEGVYNVIGVPTLSVHDETDNSVIDESKEQNEAYTYLKYIMENTVKLRVPIRLDMSRGTDWGSIE